MSDEPGTTETAHKHSFPCNPPGGSYLNPGPCECGKTYDQDGADRMLAVALKAAELAYGTAPRVLPEAVREEIATQLDTLAQAAQDIAQRYKDTPVAYAEMTGKASAYWKAAQIARGVTGGEGWGEP